MDKHKELYVIQQIYGTLFALANKLQAKGDAYLSSIASRQFMGMLAVLHLPEGEATIINIANKLGTTKQSARQMISSLEQKGYIVAKEMTKRALEQFARQRAADAEPLVGKLNGIAKREGVEHDV